MDYKVIAQAACSNFIVMFVGVCLAFYYLAHPVLNMLAAFLEALSSFGSGY